MKAVRWSDAALRKMEGGDHEEGEDDGASDEDEESGSSEDEEELFADDDDAEAAKAEEELSTRSPRSPISGVQRSVCGPMLLSGKRLKLGLGGGLAKKSGKWCKPLLCEVIGDTWGVGLGSFEVGVAVLAPPEASPRSRLLLLHPRHRILNRSGADLQYKSRDGHLGGILQASERTSIGASGSVPFHWGETPSRGRYLQLKPRRRSGYRRRMVWCLLYRYTY